MGTVTNLTETLRSLEGASLRSLEGVTLRSEAEMASMIHAVGRVEGSLAYVRILGTETYVYAGSEDGDSVTFHTITGEEIPLSGRIRKILMRSLRAWSMDILEWRNGADIDEE